MLATDRATIAESKNGERLTKPAARRGEKAYAASTST
jgi:hypothetical protein